MKTLIVIPARMASSRLPGKPLIDLNGKSLIQRTYECCLKAVPAERIVVATDHHKIKEHCANLNIQAIMTSENCLTGTDRVAEVAKKMAADTYINVQGDEPLMNTEDILKTLYAAKQYPEDIINGYAPISSEKDYRSLTIPKVVFRPDGRLLYMSRSPIPGNKSDLFQGSWRQVCIYAFPKKALQEFSAQEAKTRLEEKEDIEILRFLEMGFDVRMIELSQDSVAVDTPEDAARVRKILKETDRENSFDPDCKEPKE